MMPVVFRLPYINWDIPGYGVMMMLGFLAAILWAARRAGKSGGNPDVVLNCGFVALIAGVVGGRMMYVIHNWGQFAGHGSLFNMIWGIVDVSKGGLEYYGGFIMAAVCVSVWLVRYEKVSWRWYMDIIAPSAVVGLAFGRVGCFLNGCCFGGATDLPWRVTFPFGSPAQMQYWEERATGTDIPQELIFATPGSYDLKGISGQVSGVFPTGAVAIPLTRESIAASDQEIAVAQRDEDAARAELEQLRTSGAPDAAVQKARIALAKAQQKFIDIRDVMHEYNISAGEIRALAANHRSIAVHPAQLYSTITALLIAGMLNAIYWRRSRDGVVVCALFIIEPISRFVIELLRTDNPIDVLGIFTISQFLSLCMIAAAVLGLIILQFMPVRSKRAAIFEPEAETASVPAGAKKHAPA